MPLHLAWRQPCQTSQLRNRNLGSSLRCVLRAFVSEDLRLPGTSLSEFGLARPQWPGERAWEATAMFCSQSKRHEGWSIRPSTETGKFAPENAPVFGTVRTGALDHVKRLSFQRGASPTDASYLEGKTIM